MRGTSIGISLLLAALAPALGAKEAEPVILQVIVNAQDKGVYFLSLTPGGDILIPVEDLEQMGLQNLPQELGAAAQGSVSLKSLAPAVRFTIDEHSSALVMTVSSQLLPRSRIDFAPKSHFEAVPAKTTAAFLNYQLAGSFTDDLRLRSVNIPWEAGVKVHGLLGQSSFAYTGASGQQRLVRMMTSLVKEDPDKLRKLTLGDFQATSGRLGSSGFFAGLSLSTSFSMNPSLRASPQMDLAGVLETPSEVRLYVNDTLVRTEQLPAGQFEVLSLPVTSGAGDVTVVIRDAYGREQQITSPFYQPSMLLREGLHEYSYNLGFRRVGFGQESFDYGDLSFLGFHRIGLGKTFTGGFRAEGDRDTLNLGPTAAFTLGKAGEIDTAVAFSRASGQSGLGGVLSYAYQGRKLSGRLALEGFSRDYTSLSSSTATRGPRYSGLVGLGFSTKSLGSIAGSLTLSRLHDETLSHRASVSYARTLHRNLSLSAQVSAFQQPEAAFEGRVALSFSLGASRSASASLQAQDGRTNLSVSLRKNQPLGTGLGYGLRMDSTEGSGLGRQTAGQVSAQYRSPYGIVSLDYRNQAGSSACDLRLSGGLAFINRSFYLSRPIADGFAVVKVGDLEGVPVSFRNQRVGVTNRRGEVFVPDLVAYSENKIVIDAKDLPIDRNVPETAKSVTTSLRGGAVVKFEASKLQSFEGRLYFVQNGKKHAAEFAGLDLQVGDQRIESIVGRGGTFYLENLPVGTFPARLYLEDKECRFQMVIPESNETTVDLGQLGCEVQAD